MSEQELNSYRFTSGNEPTDEMLAQIMHEVAVDAERSNKLASESHFAQMREQLAVKKSRWASRIKEIM